jgi:NTE family protein
MLLRSARRAAGMRTGFVGLYSTNKLAEFVNSRVPPERQNIEQTAIPFAAVATNLLDGKVYALDSGNLGKALQASSAVPFYVKPIPYDGKLLLDGALRANVPTVQARQSGADIVISVNVDEDLQTVNKDSLRSMRHYGTRLMSMMLAGIDEHQGEIADLEIRPTLVSMPLYSRSDKDAIRAMIAGAQAAASAVPEIKLLLNSKLAHEPR